MLIALDLTALVPKDLISAYGTGLRMTRLVPMKLKRRGVETRLVVPGEADTTSHSDPALLRAVARSYQWFSELASGKEISTRRIAIREKVDDSFVRKRRLIGLPKTIERVVQDIRSQDFGTETVLLFTDTWRSAELSAEQLADIERFRQRGGVFLPIIVGGPAGPLSPIHLFS